jgi:hypothetical protein
MEATESWKVGRLEGSFYAAREARRTVINAESLAAEPAGSEETLTPRLPDLKRPWLRFAAGR